MMLRITVAAILIFAGAAALEAQSLPPITNQDVIDMVSVQLSANAITTVIESSTPAFDFSDREVTRLKSAGVSDALLAAMRRVAAQASAGAPATAVTAAETSGTDTTLTNRSIVAMVAAGLADDVIVAAIQAAETVSLQTDASALVALQRQGVSSPVLKAMIEARRLESARKKGESPDAHDSAAGARALPDKTSTTLAAEVRQLEQQLADLQRQREQLAADVRRADNSGKLGSFGCDKSSVLGAVNCLSADLNGRLVASGTARLAQLDTQITDLQSRLSALRIAAARDPGAMSLLLEPAVGTEAREKTDYRTTTGDAGKLYFYRRSGMLMSSFNPTVVCDGEELALIAKNRFFEVALSPGRHSCSLVGKSVVQEPREIVMNAGERQFFRVTYQGTSYGFLERIDPTSAREELAQLKPRPTQVRDIRSGKASSVTLSAALKP
jgi:hypothetical protein